ncbi:MAG: DUF1460 domain-containing protein [Phycisphaerales bacterium]|nr:DUF1460 domain-containing protein [Phycisphaerales bacterium]
MPAMRTRERLGRWTLLLALAATMAAGSCTPEQARYDRASEPRTAATTGGDRTPDADVSDLTQRPLYTLSEDELDRYLEVLPTLEPDLHRRVVRLARQNLGQPYDIYLLGEFPYETYDVEPIYCLTRGDCVVSVEHLYSMALAHDWWSFMRTLQRIRYKHGTIGMLTRNHYGIADWDRNNAFLFEDITAAVGGGDVAVPLKQVCRRARFFAKFGIGQDIPDEPVHDWYIPKERIPEVEHEFRNADLVNIIRGNAASQYSGHFGMIAIADDGTVDFLHSASPKSREQPLVDYVMHNKGCLGIKVLRLRDDAAQRMADALADAPEATPVSASAMNAALAARRAQGSPYVRYPKLDWKQASHLQAYRLDADTPTDAKLQQELERIDRAVGEALGMAAEQRAIGVLSLNDQRLAMVHPDAMFYGASVPKICILLAYFATHPEAATDLPDDVRAELGRMIKVSDNAMAAKYSQLIGIDKIQEVIQSKEYGFYDKDAQTGLWFGKHYGVAEPRYGDPVHDFSHAVTVRQCLRYLLLLEQGKLVSAAASRQMRDIFATPELELHNQSSIRGLQGRDVIAIRKSGTWEDWHLDIARIEHGDEVYLLAGATQHPQGADYLAQVAAQIDDVLCGAADVRPFQHQHLAHANMNVLVPCPVDSNGPPGTFESDIITTDRLFNEALISWNIDAPPHVGYVVELRVGRQRDDFWTPYLHISGNGHFGGEAAPMKCDDGYIDVDYFRADTRFDRVQYRVRALCNAVPNSPAPPQAKLRIRRVDLTLSDTTRTITSVPKPEPFAEPAASAFQRRLDVPYRSQKVERKEIRGRICSPTSVSMVLAYRGVSRPTEQVADVIYDTTSGIYGNWPRAVQGAYRFGVPGFLDRFSRWVDVERCIAVGQPLVISIEAAEGDLPNAPYRATEGHLLVLAGFDAHGDVLVNDPAAGDAAKGQVAYRRSDLEKVWWEARGGTAYVLLNPQASAPVSPPADLANEPLVEITDVDPRIIVDLRYATPDNFTKQVLYPEDMRCRLRQSVAERLRRVEDQLAARGLGLKIYDGLRPMSVQRTMWSIMPDPHYVADPAKGSRHNRGAAVDVTLVDLNGCEVEMPTPYDDFTDAAHRDYTGGSETALANRALLEEVMTAEGFSGLSTEWWHFDAPDWRSYPLVDAGE